MKIGFVVNQTPKEAAAYTTTGLALRAASQMGHEIYYIGVGDLTYTDDEQMGAHARKVPDKQFRTNTTFMEAVKKSSKELISSKELDILMLRNDPSIDFEKRPWAQNVGMLLVNWHNFTG